jgi:predicted transposase/invertase (TIGR01784 family)
MKADMEKGFISPLNDYVVKSVFGDQKNIENTEVFLKAILDIPPEEYDKLIIRDSFLRRRWKKDKQGILDIRLTTTSGREVDIEVQVNFYKAMLQRIIYYNAKMVTEQMESGFEYDKIRQTIVVVITNHTLFHGETGYLNTYELRNSKTGRLFTDLQKYVTLELPKAPETDDGHPAWSWAQFFKSKNTEDLNMLVKKHPEIKSAAEEYQRISWSKKRRMIADFKEKQRHDRWAMLEYAKDEGREEGLTKGREGSGKRPGGGGLDPIR